MQIRFEKLMFRQIEREREIEMLAQSVSEKKATTTKKHRQEKVKSI